MSIYALPGPLYKLISSGASTKSSKADAEEACSCKDTSLISRTPLPTGTSAPAVAVNPLLRRPSSSSLPGSLPSDPNTLAGTSNSSHGRTKSIRRSESDVKLAVTEAKIDPARLIRSLSITKPETKKAPSAGCEGTAGDDTSKTAPSSSTSSSCSSQRRRRSRKIDSSCDSSDCNRQCDPHEDAINFEISVRFCGREYTATRTLPRILQFRYDLIEEKRMCRERRRMRKERKRRPSKPPQMAKVYYPSDDEDESSQDDSSQDDNSIPELPRLSEDAAGSGGFTMLNALLRPYGPALERWLHSVIDIVPHDSQCLTQFLWEPLAVQAQDTPPTSAISNSSGRCHERRKTYERRASSTLLAIGEETDQYDSDTDEYLLNTC